MVLQFEVQIIECFEGVHSLVTLQH